MPRFTPEKERSILESYDRTPTYAAVAREQEVNEKAVKSVVIRRRKREMEIAKSAEVRSKDPLPQNEERTKLTPDRMKRLYELFKKGSRLAGIVADEGFDPEVVENEHERFLRFEGLDPHSMQEKIMNRLAHLVPERGWKRKETFDIYRDKFDKYHYLNGRQFEDLVSMLEFLSHRAGLNSVQDPSMPPPAGWTRPKCGKCGEALSGLVFDPADPWVNQFQAVQGDWHHVICPRVARIYSPNVGDMQPDIGGDSSHI